MHTHIVRNTQIPYSSPTKFPTHSLLQLLCGGRVQHIHRAFNLPTPSPEHTEWNVG
jgi:hypothetical protein